MSLCRRPIRRIALSAKTGSFINRIPLRSFSQQNISRQSEQTQLTNQQPQLIGEERRDDAIFKIYFKRVRHKPTNPADASPALTDGAQEQNGTTGDSRSTNDHGTLLYSTIKVFQLKAGTLEKIVECLTNENGELDCTHMQILLSTYRTYATPRLLVEALIARYRTVLPASLDMTEDTRQKTLKSLRLVIKCLLNSYKEDFHEPPNYSTLIYLMKHIPDRELQHLCQNLLEQFTDEEDEDQSTVDKNNNFSSTDHLYTQRGFDYVSPWSLLDMSSAMVAEQLTIVDADLLKRVLPYECLTMSTSSCSRRAPANSAHRTLSTVDKTIEHFNAVVARVVATILKESDEQLRASVMEKWIDIAHQCRLLKNFSSLTAILNGLQSGCIYRLSTAWSYVSQEYKPILEELKNIFGSCGDRQQARAILEQQLEEARLALSECAEGTAKYADVNPSGSVVLSRKFRHKNGRDQDKKTMNGTVPYLGLYLSDLTYIDSAHPNTIAIDESSEKPFNGSLKLINFEKHRKEFDILAQIKLFQSAANAYTSLHSLPRFRVWFDNVRTYTDSESWELSYQIEPKETTDSSPSPDHFSRTYGAQPLKALLPRFPSQVSLESLGATHNNGSTIVSGGSLRSTPSSTSLDKLSTASIQSFHRFHFPSPQTKTDKKPHINHSRSSSASSVLTSSNGSTSQGYGSNTGSPTISAADSTQNSTDSDTIIAKVHFAGRNDLLYKKVRIGNNERTTSVLKTILDKFGLDPSKYAQYCIEQQLPDRKILIPDHCNVFYALARPSPDDQVELLVREKTRQEREQKQLALAPDLYGHHRTPSGMSISSTHSR